MASDADVLIKLGLDLKDVKSEIASFKEEMKKSSEESGDNFSNSLSNKISGGLKKLAVGFAAFGATVAAGKFLSGAISEASEAQNSLVRLNNALSLSGSFTTQARDNFLSLAKSLEGTANVSEEAIIDLVSLGKNMGFTNQRVESLTKAAVELSAVTGQDLSSAFRVLGNTTTGELGKLGKSIPELQNLSKEALKAGAAIDFVNQRFKGTAENQTNTFSGSLTKLKISFENLQESFGNLIVNSPGLVAIFNKVTETIRGLTKSLEDSTKSGALDRILLDLISFSDGILKWVIRPIEVFFNSVKTGFLTIGAGITGLANVLTGGSFESLSTLSETLNQSLTEAANTAFETPVTDKVNAFVTELGIAVETAKPLATNAGQNLGSAVSVGMTEELKKGMDQISNILRNGFINVVSATFQRLGASLAQGGKAFQGFAQQVLGIIGDMAIQIGQTMIGIGIGIDALKASLVGLSGGVVIAAGLALIAIGGLLKSLSGGGGVGVPAQAGAGPVGGSPTFSQPGTDVGVIQEEQKPKTNVVVNVQGNILDRRESGLAIAEIINETFGSNGVVVASA